MQIIFRPKALHKPREDLIMPAIHPFSGRLFKQQEQQAWKVVRGCWDHLLESSGAKQKTDKVAILKQYKDAVAGVKNQIRSIYAYKDEELGGGISSRWDDELMKKMIKQGCFMLQLALFSLGGLKEHPVFHQAGLEKISYWVACIFRFKNQIPLVVLRELMKQSFFESAVRSGNWKRPKDIPRTILFDFLLQPMLIDPRNKTSFIRKLRNFAIANTCVDHAHREPPTLVHALWLSVTGRIHSGGAGKVNEAEEEDIGEWSTVRSATELQKVGINFRSNEGKGTRGIKFEKQMLEAVLYLPLLSIESSTKELLQNLIDYETNTSLGRHQREVCAYLKLMSELVRTPEDAKVLAQHGVIHGDPKQEEQLPAMLTSFWLKDAGNNQNLGLVRRQICIAYVKPKKWEKLRYLLILTVLLTLVQTIYSVLSFHLK
uniref:Uncharacterized protein n=1 Tax=Nelumbo nucifera TaxID=4432 RepID=A0A822YLW3_NELNU|nr:TPA_asm: hypothetical protein HUJ06_011140 [Nelumbo nucifera]